MSATIDWELTHSPPPLMRVKLLFRCCEDVPIVSV